MFDALLTLVESMSAGMAGSVTSFARDLHRLMP